MIKKHLSVPIILLMFSLSLFCSAQETQGNRLIKIETSLGDMVIKLYDATPAHRDNMIQLIQKGFYNDQLFHRVIKNFMVQGGDPNSSGAKKGERLGTGGPGYTVPAEINPNLIHKKGALAAARLGYQNPLKESSGSQFYLVQGTVMTPEQLKLIQQKGETAFTEKSVEIYTTLGGTPHLDGSYTVFGELIEGMEILDLIANSPTEAADRPVEDIVYSISIIK